MLFGRTDAPGFFGASGRPMVV
jgi:hypothetical protein